MIKTGMNLVPEIWQFCLKRILTRFSDIPTAPANSCGRGNHPALPKTWPVINCKFSHSIRCLLKCFLRHFLESFKIYQIWKELFGEKNLQAWSFSCCVKWKKWTENQNGILLLKSLALFPYTYQVLGAGKGGGGGGGATPKTSFFLKQLPVFWFLWTEKKVYFHALSQIGTCALLHLCAIPLLIWLGLQLWLCLSMKIHLFLNSETRITSSSLQDSLLWSTEATVEKAVLKLQKYFSPSTTVIDKWITEAVEDID